MNFVYLSQYVTHTRSVFFLFFSTSTRFSTCSMTCCRFKNQELPFPLKHLLFQKRVYFIFLERVQKRDLCNKSFVSSKDSCCCNLTTTVSGKLGNKNIGITSRTGSGSANLNSQSRHASGKSHSTHIMRSSSVGILNQVL